MSAQPQPGDLEALLSRALAPVDPPEHLAARMEEHLTTITSLAASADRAWRVTSSTLSLSETSATKRSAMVTGRIERCTSADFTVSKRE